MRAVADNHFVHEAAEPKNRTLFEDVTAVPALTARIVTNVAAVAGKYEQTIEDGWRE